MSRRHPTKGVFASKLNKTSSILSTSQSRFASKRSDINASQSRKSVTLIDAKIVESRTGPGRIEITVRDDEGNDVTPKPLFVPDPAVMQKYQSQLFGSDNQSAGTPTDFTSSASMFQTGQTSVYAQPFTRSVFGSKSDRSAVSKTTQSSVNSSGEIGEQQTMPADVLLNVTIMRPEVKEDLTEEDLNKVVDITLEETETIWLYEAKSVAVSNECEDHDQIVARNAKYEELCKTRAGNDRYAERGMQTFNQALKNKDLQTDKIGMTEAEVNVTTWDMYDTLANDTETDLPHQSIDGRDTPGDISRPMSTISGGGGKSKVKLGSEETSMMESKITESRSSAVTFEQESFSKLKESESKFNEIQAEAILSSQALMHDLVVMERVVTENIYQPKQAAYRGFEILPDPDKIKSDAESPTSGASPGIMTSMGPTLDRLWSYNCSATKGRNVASMAWNKLNPDILAVGYGHFGFNEQQKAKGGLTCCWNIKNPEYPERIFHTSSGVTAIDFSSANPNLLAVGLYDGTVAIYNVRSLKDAPVLDSFECMGKHSSPVWQLCWVDKERGVGEDKTEILVSVCADGRIVQWSIRKGFECTDLMKLKRTAGRTQSKKKEKTEAYISRHTPGLCFDFQEEDSNIYLAGTEEGLIHKCSRSYNEQFLDTYEGHTGPIYKVHWSPFAPEVFLSSSADWSIRLWTQASMKPALNFFSSTKSVYDICWSRFSSTVFCAINEGSVEIWDLKVNTLDPLVVTLASPGVHLSSCLFAKNSNSILIGDSDGQVSVYQLRNMPQDHGEGATDLLDVINASRNTQVQKKDETSNKK